MSDTGSRSPVITVPERHAIALSKFAALSDDKQKLLYQTAGEIPPGPQAWDILKDAIADQLDMTGDDAKTLAAAMMGLFYARQRASDRTDSEYIQAAIQGIRKAASKSKVSQGDVQKVLVNVLALPNLELAYRAGRVRFDHAYHMHDAGIVTDIRPIFDVSASSIEGAVICHVLKIGYAGSNEDDKDLYLAVDDDDLEKLEAAIKRARRKAVALRSFAKKAKLKIIEDNL